MHVQTTNQINELSMGRNLGVKPRLAISLFASLIELWACQPSCWFNRICSWIASQSLQHIVCKATLIVEHSGNSHLLTFTWRNFTLAIILWLKCWLMQLFWGGQGGFLLKESNLLPQLLSCCTPPCFIYDDYNLIRFDALMLETCHFFN